MTSERLELFQSIAQHQGVTMPEHRIEQAAAGFDSLADRIAEMRSIRFDFLTNVIEPGTALQWLENGGRS